MNIYRIEPSLVLCDPKLLFEQLGNNYMAYFLLLTYAAQSVRDGP